MEIVLSGSRRRWSRTRRVLAVAAVVAVAGALVLPMPTTVRVVAVGLPALVLTLVSLLVLLGAVGRPAVEPGEGPDDARGERHGSPPDRGAGGGRALDRPATVSDLPRGALGSAPRDGSGGAVAHSAGALLMLVPSPRRPWDDYPGDLGRLVR